MEIPSSPSQLLFDTGKSNLNLDKLQTGQQLYAKVVEQLPNKTDVIIRLGNQLIHAKSDIPTTIGETIKVVVEKTSSQLTLKVAPPPLKTDIINNALRLLLPKQNPVNDFQQPLKQFFTSQSQPIANKASGHALSLETKVSQLQHLTTDIIQSLPNQKSISTFDGLRQAIKNSGLFLEPRLQQVLLDNKAAISVKNSTSASTSKEQISLLTTNKNLINTALADNNLASTRVDLKANLIKLIQLLKSWPKQTAPAPESRPKQLITPTLSVPLTKTATPTAILQTPQQNVNTAKIIDNQVKDLLTKTEGAISKITLNQLASSPTETANTARQAWQIEIPLFNSQASESIFMKIERDETGNKASKTPDKQWTVTLEMKPPKLGLIKNKLTLTDQQISSSFWAEKTGTRTLIQQHLNILREQFNRADLKPENIQVQQGAGPSIQDKKPDIAILNEKA